MNFLGRASGESLHLSRDNSRPANKIIIPAYIMKINKKTVLRD